MGCMSSLPEQQMVRDTVKVNRRTFQGLDGAQNQTRKSRSLSNRLSLIQKHSLFKSQVFQKKTRADTIASLDEMMEKKLQIKSNQEIKYGLVFRASKNNFSSCKFHQKCSQASKQNSKSLLLVKTSDNALIGGFTPCKWLNGKAYLYQQDPNAQSFLFVFHEKSKVFRIFPIDQNQKDKAIMNDDECGPVFGSGHDLYIRDKCDKNQSWANLGKTYKIPQGFKFGSNKANELMAGKLRFYIDQYEVWSVSVSVKNQ